jgi:glucans biosynthesis protein C
MQQATDFQVKTDLQPRYSTAAPQRLAYIDAARILLIVLVIMVHAAVTYGSLGGWYYQDPVKDQTTAIGLTLFAMVCQSFFMGLFFFISGYFTPGSVDRKGLLAFGKDRLLRLGIPLMVFIYFLSKIPIYLGDVSLKGLKMPFFQFAGKYFWRAIDAGPTWFLSVLLVFAAGYALWRLATVRFAPLATSRQLPVPGKTALLGFGLLMALIMFVICQFNPLVSSPTLLGAITFLVSFMPQYILMYVAGLLAYRNDWLSRLPDASLRFWGWLAAGLTLCLPVFTFLSGAVDGNPNILFTGLTWQCLVMNLWTGLACVAYSLAILLWLRQLKFSSSRLVKAGGANTFTVYLIHPLLLVPLTTLGLSHLAIPPLVKFVIASVITVAICFGLASLLRRIPGAKAILDLLQKCLRVP